MFAQLANTILHGVRIFDEAAKNTTPAEMNRPDDCDEARSGHQSRRELPQERKRQ